MTVLAVLVGLELHIALVADEVENNGSVFHGLAVVVAQDGGRRCAR